MEPLGEDVLVGDGRGESGKGGLPVPDGTRLELPVLGDLLPDGALQVGDLVARERLGVAGAARDEGDAAVGAHARGAAGLGFVVVVVGVGLVNLVQRHTVGGYVGKGTWEDCEKSHEQSGGHHFGEI